MGKKVNLAGILITIVAVAGLVCGGLLIFNEKLPQGMIIIGCSVIMMALPSLMKPAESSVVNAKTKSVKTTKKSDVVTVRDVENASILCKCAGRCRIDGGTGHECTLRVTETSVEFILVNDKMLTSALRKNVTDVECINSHTLVLCLHGVNDTKSVRFVSNDTNSLTFINQLLSRVA